MARYQLEVAGELGARFDETFGATEREARGGRTILTVELADQAALHGLFEMLEALGVELLGVARMESDS